MSQDKKHQNISTPCKAPHVPLIHVTHPSAICFPGKPFLAQLLCEGWFLILHSVISHSSFNKGEIFH